MHQTAHTSFVSDLGMNPPPAWSKPALGLTNSMNHHLPQAQSVRELQEQIQQHRRLQQQQSQSGYGLGGHTMKKKHCQQSGNSNNNSNNNNSNKEHNGGNGGSGNNTTYQPSFGSGHQHINIKNTDDSMNSDEETDEDNDDMDNNNSTSVSRNYQSGMQGQHHRSLPHPQLTQGFAIPTGFTGFAPSSPLSPSSSESITSDSSAMTASILSPGVYSPGCTNSSNNNGSSIHGIESSLASLASLSVMSASASSSAMSMSIPGRSRAGFSPTHLATTPTTSSFQQQSLPMIYQNQASGIMGSHHGHPPHASGFLPTSSAAPSFNVFSSALSQHFQRQQQQQMTSAALSSSLPAHSGFNQLQQQPHLAHTQHIQNQPREQQDENQQQGRQPGKQQSQKRTRSKSLTIPAPRIIPPTRILPPRQPQTSAPRKYHGRQQRKVPSAQPTTPKENADPTRRVAHIISEQKRREKINGGFDELKSVIPE
ncbi:hypothetical protein BG011_005535 [Mortierella polycephala]|uniref:BHLH domain-containing protein n=1 Tax=Mortierella polycephala TaxID=41804 RepID=A0A9P6U0S5_9FUNG|nr:hypothetical protein BG011_005535 [Mortierella polycephala]